MACSKDEVGCCFLCLFGAPILRVPFEGLWDGIVTKLGLAAVWCHCWRVPVRVARRVPVMRFPIKGTL